MGIERRVGVACDWSRLLRSSNEILQPVQPTPPTFFKKVGRVMVVASYRKVLGNRVAPVAKPEERGPDVQWAPTIRKVPADSVPYGDAICTRGHHVWAAYDADRLVCVGATAKEARSKYRRIRRGTTVGRPPVTYPDELEGRKDKPHRLRPGEDP
jgi:hypothetical protein